MIPLINVSLVLLVFFMMTAGAIAVASNIQLPEAAHNLTSGNEAMIWVGVQAVEADPSAPPYYSIGEGENPPTSKDDEGLTEKQVLDRLDAKLKEKAGRKVDVQVPRRRQPACRLHPPPASGAGTPPRPDRQEISARQREEVMSWKVRHEGSPRAVDGLTPGQVAQGLLDGRWEPTDEVMGPQDQQWTALENHPQFAEVALEVEPPPAKPYDDETRLDMNAMINVCLVLLVFFILTTSYAALQRLIDMPGTSQTRISGAPKITDKEVKELMIKVEVRMVRGPDDKDVPVVKIEGDVVPKDDLQTALSRFVKDTRKTELLIDYSPRVPYGLIIAIQDAAAGAGIRQVHILVPREEEGK